MAPWPSSPGRGLALFGLLSLLATAIGCGVASASGVPMAVWVRNPIAWAVGAVLAAAMLARAGGRVELAVMAAAPLGLLATLADPGRLGVHRWIDLGPLYVNAAQVLLPPAIVALAARRESLGSAAVAAAAMALLVAQPDASQATALGAAVLVAIGAAPLTRRARVPAMAAVGLAVAASWLRADPLEPVPEVEEILRLAWEISPFVAIAAGIALLAALGALARVRAPEVRCGARALAAYALVSAAAALAGPFPVPLVGMAVSPILGLWLGAGLLAAQARRVNAYSRAASDA